MKLRNTVLSKDILNTCYNFAEKLNCEIIRFAYYKGNGIIAFDKYVNKYGNKLIYQPELSTNIFYGNNELEVIDYNIYNKFIKKEVYIKSLNILNHFYLNIRMTFWEDQLMNYILLRTAKILYFSKKIGYYYLKNSISITKNIFKINQLRIQFIFIYLKLIFEYSKNTKFEKDMANLLFKNIFNNFKIKRFLSKLISIDNFKFYNDIIKMYLNCKFINYYNKYTLKYLNKILKKRKKFLKRIK